jgi:hypothetical protein
MVPNNRVNMTNKVFFQSSKTPLIFFLLAFFFLAPLHTLVKVHIGFSIYPYLALGLLAFLGLALRKVYRAVAATVWREPGNWLMLAFIALLMPKMQTTSDLSTFAGAIVAPFLIGVLFARLKPMSEQSFDITLVAFLAAKVCLLLCFVQAFMAEYPARPLFEGRAIYLQFGWGIEVFPSVLLLLVQWRAQSGRRFGVAIVAGVGVLLSAFVLVGMNSRSLLLIALVLTVATCVLYVRPTLLQMLGLVGFPLCVALFLWLLPNRLDHLIRMLDTVLCGVGVDELFCAAGHDRSAEMRLDRIAMGFSTPENLIYGAEPDFLSVFFKGSHFWPAQVFYYFGVVGFSAFSLVFGRFSYCALRIMHTAQRNGGYGAGLGLFALAFGLHVFYAGNLFNDPVLFLLMGLVVNIAPCGSALACTVQNPELRLDCVANEASNTVR